MSFPDNGVCFQVPSETGRVRTGCLLGSGGVRGVRGVSVGFGGCPWGLGVSVGFGAVRGVWGCPWGSGMCPCSSGGGGVRGVGGSVGLGAAM